MDKGKLIDIIFIIMLVAGSILFIVGTISSILR